MNFRSVRLWCILAGLLVFAQQAPAPLIYTPGEGWRYERVGGEGKWIRARAPDQLEVAQAAFDKKDYSLALKAARRTVQQWPYSDAAPKAQYLVARCYEAQRKDEKAFKAYQHLVEHYPKLDLFDEVAQRQFRIANRFLAGQRFKLWGYIPTFPSMDRTIKYYEQIVKNGPYSEIAPKAQMNIGAAYEKKIGRDSIAAAAKAYELAADRYSDQPAGVEALYNAGLAYNRQAKTAEYDQSIAGQAIATFGDFATLYPDDKRVAGSQELIESLKIEQARGNYVTARYYEQKGKWSGAKIYYNSVIDTLRDRPEHPYAELARRRIDAINKRLQPAG